MNKRYSEEIFFALNDIDALKKASQARIWVSYDLPLHFFILYFLKNKKRIVYYLGHGIPLKRIALASFNISILKVINRYLRVSCYTHVLSFSDYLIPVMQEAFGKNKKKFIPIGPPVNDNIFFDNSYIKKKFLEEHALNSKHILYAPTWRENTPCEFFPFHDLDIPLLLNYLEKNNIYIHIRPHGKKPFILNEELLESKMFDSNKYPDVAAYLNMFDGLITDYSSIYFDFLLFNKPICFIPYDIKEYEKKPGFSLAYNDVTPGHKIYNFNDFINYFEQLKLDIFYIKRKEVLDMLNLKITV